MVNIDDILARNVKIEGYEDKVLNALYFNNIGADSIGREIKVDVKKEDLVDGKALYPVKAIMKNYKNTEVVETIDIELLMVEIDKDSVLQTESERLEIVDDSKPVVVFFEIGEPNAPTGLPMKVNIDSGKIASVDFIDLDYTDLKEDDTAVSNFIRYLNNVGYRDDYITKYCKLVYDPKDLRSIIKLNVFSMLMKKPLEQINIIDCNNEPEYNENDMVVSLVGSEDVANLIDTVERVTQEIRKNKDSVDVPPVIKYLNALDSRVGKSFDEIVYALELLLEEEDGAGKLMEAIQSLIYGKIPNDDEESYNMMLKRLNSVNSYKAKVVSDNLEELTTVQDVVETTVNSNARLTMYDEGIEALDILFSNKLNDPEYESYINVSKKADKLEVLIYEEVGDIDVDKKTLKDTTIKYYISIGVLDSMFENNTTLESDVEIIESEENRYIKCKVLVPIKESILF